MINHLHFGYKEKKSQESIPRSAIKNANPIPAANKTQIKNGKTPVQKPGDKKIGKRTSTHREEVTEPPQKRRKGDISRLELALAASVPVDTDEIIEDHQPAEVKTPKKKKKAQQPQQHAVFRKTPFRQRVRTVGNEAIGLDSSVDGDDSETLEGGESRDNIRQSGHKVMFSEGAYQVIESNVAAVVQRVSTNATTLALLEGRKGANIGHVETAKFLGNSNALSTVPDVYNLCVANARLPPADSKGNYNSQNRGNLKPAQIEILSEYYKYTASREKTKAAAIKLNQNAPPAQRERLSYTLSGFSPLALEHLIMPHTDPELLNKVVQSQTKHAKKRHEIGLDDGTSSDGGEHSDAGEADSNDQSSIQEMSAEDSSDGSVSGDYSDDASSQDDSVSDKKRKHGRSDDKDEDSNVDQLSDADDEIDQDESLVDTGINSPNDPENLSTLEDGDDVQDMGDDAENTSD